MCGALIRLSVGCSFVRPVRIRSGSAWIFGKHVILTVSVCLLDEDEGSHPTVLQGPEGER